MQKLIELYKQWSGEEPQNVQQLTAGGSNREYYRMTSSEGKSVVGCVGTSRDENHAFIYLAKHFTDCKLPVPTILAVSNDELRYIQTDLGSISLFDAIRGGREAGGRYTLKEQELLRRTIRELPRIQMAGADGLDFSNCYPQPAFNSDSVLFDLNYFKYCFLKATEVDFHELKLEADFRLLAKDLTNADDPQGFLYRDFQARNVMLVNSLHPTPSTQHPTPSTQHPTPLLHRLPRWSQRPVLLRFGLVPVAGLCQVSLQGASRVGLRVL